MKKQDLIKAIEIHMELGGFKNKFFEVFNGCVRYGNRRFNRPEIIYREINRRK